VNWRMKDSVSFDTYDALYDRELAAQQLEL
jgi:hypothetical protein